MRRLLLSCSLFVLLLAAWPQAGRAQNTLPVANPDNVRTPQGQPILIDVLANDTDADAGDTLNVIALPTLPTKGSAVIVVSAGRTHVYYIPNANALGTDPFTYRISDGNGGEATSTIVVTIFRIIPPVAKDDQATLFSHETVEVAVLANDRDPDGTVLNLVSLAKGPSHGTAAILRDTLGQRIRYTPDVRFEGRDTLRYVIEDADEATDTASVFFDVLINRPPVAGDDSVSIAINAAFEINVLANDTDHEDDPLTVLAVSVPPQHGQAVIVANGTRIRYTPQGGFLGTDRFEYTLSDGLTRDGSPVGDRATVSIQVLPTGGSFEARLSGGSEVPATRSRASGLIFATINGNRLSLSGTFSLLESDFAETIGANLYLGSAGQRGDLLLPLSVNLGADNRSGVFNSAANTFTLTEAERAALFTRRLYVNVHSEALPDGAIRGQLLPSEPTALFQAVLSGRAEVPANRAGGVGGAVAELYDNLLVVTGAFQGLESDFAVGAQGGAHIHEGDLSVNGAIQFALAADLDADRRGGRFEASRNVFTLTDEQVQRLRSGLFYVNVHTNERPAGALRGQLLPTSTRLFEAMLAGDNEVPPLQTPGSGAVLALLDGTTLAVSGAFSGLASGVDLSLRNGAHLHLGAPDEAGGILFELAPVLGEGRRSGFFSAGGNTLSLAVEDLDALFAGRIYVNVHTDNHPGGALRGQLLPSANLAPTPSTIAAPVDGSAVDVTRDPNTPFVPRWFGGIDVNGNPIYYRWQLALDPGFGTVIFASAPSAATQTETTLGALEAVLRAHGITPSQHVTAYHRVLSTDGSLTTAGPTARVVLGDDTATGLEAGDLPRRFAVLGNYPNPFNPSTTLQVDLPQAARVHVEVYDLLGRRVLATPAQPLEAGARRALSLDAGALASGVYFYRVVARAAAETFTGTGRLTVVK